MTLLEVKLRPATDEDYDFMRLLYHSTRAEEMVRFPFSEEQKSVFLDSQFAAQSSHYALHYPDCERLIIERNGSPVGRLYVDRTPAEVCVVDIALLPEARGKGIGTSLLRTVMAEAARDQLPVKIHVEAFNPALRLYEREGFRTIGTNGIYFLMEWRAPSTDYVKTASY